MINLPDSFKQRMHHLLGQEAWAEFTAALQEEAPVSIRYNRQKSAIPQETEQVSWCEAGLYLPTRPVFTLDPLLHAGAYYVQEASSMFLEQAAALWRGQTNLHFLDLCAAPGGKSTHLADLMPENSLLVSNEVIRSRAAILSENLTKWGNPNVVVTHNDPKDFASLPNFFDVMLIDAPCSGEGLFRKDHAAIEEWSEDHVKLCADRQRRIVADAWAALKDEGLLLYSTCTYNREENEDNIRWMMHHLGAEVVHLSSEPAWGIVSNEYGHHFFPHKIKGEGFFMSILKKKNNAAPSSEKSRKQLPRFDFVKQAPAWLQGNFTVVRKDAFLHALTDAHVEHVSKLKAHLRVVQAGVTIGEVKGHDTVPTAALALSTALQKDAFPHEEVDLPTALRFLHRDALTLPQQEKGYCLICYQHLPLGFVKNIGTRSNNLYPPAWRIRMDVS